MTGSATLPAQTRSTSPAARVLGRAGFAVWATVSVGLVGMLMAGHLIALPHPEPTDPAVAAALGRVERTRGQWLAVHVLYEACGCSKRVLHRILDGAPRTDADELIVLVSEKPSTRLKNRADARGHRMVQVTPPELWTRFRMESAPMLALLSPAGDVAYLGGYTDRKRGPDIRTDALLAAVKAGERPRALPVYGCAVSATLQSKVDPLGLKTAAGAETRLLER